MPTDITQLIAQYAVSRKVYAEMQEPIFVDTGDTWFFETGAFSCVNGNKLKYLYCEPELRNKGTGNRLLSRVDAYCKRNKIQFLKAVVPIGKKQFYTKAGWKVEDELVNYIKIIKHYASDTK